MKHLQCCKFCNDAWQILPAKLREEYTTLRAAGAVTSLPLKLSDCKRGAQGYGRGGATMGATKASAVHWSNY